LRDRTHSYPGRKRTHRAPFRHLANSLKARRPLSGCSGGFVKKPHAKTLLEGLVKIPSRNDMEKWATGISADNALVEKPEM